MVGSTLEVQSERTMKSKLHIVKFSLNIRKGWNQRWRRTIFDSQNLNFAGAVAAQKMLYWGVWLSQIKSCTQLLATDFGILY
jgi:hypothetical protein